MGAEFTLPLRVRLAGIAGPFRAGLLLLVPALGLTFGFVAAVLGIAHATWFGLPDGVAPKNYYTLGRRGDHSGEFADLTVADFRNVQQAVPDVEWAFADRAPTPVRLYNAWGGTTSVHVREVSARFFDVLGVNVAGSPRTGSVISHEFWHRHYDGAVDAIGRPFWMEFERPSTIVGIAPDYFGDIFVGNADAWLLNDGTGYGLAALGSRLRPNGKLVFGAAEPAFTLPALSVALEGLRPVRTASAFDVTWPLADVSPDDRIEATRGISAFPDRRTAAVAHFAWLAVVIVGLLLLAMLSLIDFAAAPMASKGGGHTTARIAAGATPVHLFRESVVRHGVWLGLVATVSGIAFSWMTGVLLRVEPFRGYLDSLPTGSQVAGLGVGAVLLAGIFCTAVGWVARRDFRASRSFSAVLPSGRPRRRMQRLLLLLSVLGLVLATSLLVQYVADSGRRLGFDPDNVWRLLPLKEHGVMLSGQEANALVDLLHTLPGVEAATRGGMAPLQPRHVLPTARVKVRAPGSALESAGVGDAPSIYRNAVGSRYFDTVRARFLAGRPFESRSEAVVNQAMVDTLGLEQDDVLGFALGVDNPVGRSRDMLGGELGEATLTSPGGEVVTVVGIVADIPYGEYDDPPRPIIYQGIEHREIYDWILVRHAGDISRLESRIREGFPLLRSTYSRLMTDIFAEQFMERRAIEMLIAGASAFTLVLAFTGLAMSLARDLANDRRDIGIRMALGVTHRGFVQERVRVMWADLTVSWIAGFAVVFALKFVLPGASSVVQLWQAVPVLLLLGGALALVTHILVRDLSRRPIAELIQGVGTPGRTVSS